MEWLKSGHHEDKSVTEPYTSQADEDRKRKNLLSNKRKPGACEHSGSFLRNEETKPASGLIPIATFVAVAVTTQRAERVIEHVVADITPLFDALDFVERPMDAKVDAALAVLLLGV